MITMLKKTREKINLNKTQKRGRRSSSWKIMPVFLKVWDHIMGLFSRQMAPWPSICLWFALGSNLLQFEQVPPVLDAINLLLVKAATGTNAIFTSTVLW